MIQQLNKEKYLAGQKVKPQWVHLLPRGLVWWHYLRKDWPLLKLRCLLRTTDILDKLWETGDFKAQIQWPISRSKTLIKQNSVLTHSRNSKLEKLRVWYFYFELWCLVLSHNFLNLIVRNCLPKVIWKWSDQKYQIICQIQDIRKKIKNTISL